MPAGMQKVDGQLPGRPVFWSAVTVVEYLLVFGRQRRRAGELAPIVRGADAIPLTPEVGILAKIDHLGDARRRQQRGRHCDRPDRASVTHETSPWDRPIGACRSRTVGACSIAARYTVRPGGRKVPCGSMAQVRTVPAGTTGALVRRQGGIPSAGSPALLPCARVAPC